MNLLHLPLPNIGSYFFTAFFEENLEKQGYKLNHLKYKIKKIGKK